MELAGGKALKFFFENDKIYKYNKGKENSFYDYLYNNKKTYRDPWIN